MNKITGLNLLLGFLLAGSTVVADGVKHLETGKLATAETRRVSSLPLHASATDAASATTLTINHATAATATNALPPLPPDVTELKFSEFFRQPIGPRGLEYTDRLRSLEGRRIRILGYMVRQDKPVADCFLLAPMPMTLHEVEYGLCDDLPATTLHVFTASEAPKQTPFTPGFLLLTGTLSVSNRLEADGRISAVRLQLDPPTADQEQAVAQAAAALGQKKNSASPHDHSGHAH